MRENKSLSDKDFRKLEGQGLTVPNIDDLSVESFDWSIKTAPNTPTSGGGT